MNKKIRWTTKEVEYLVKEYQWGKQKDIQKYLKRSWRAIQKKASFFNLPPRNKGKNIIKIYDVYFSYLINNYGYMVLYNAELGIRGILAHRYIWERINKKSIPKNGQIHHKDGNILNNSPKNLELVKAKNHWYYGALGQLAKKCFIISDQHGFWERDIHGNPTRDMASGLLLIITELSEAYEAYRSGRLEGKDNLTEELADALIRLLDLSYGLGLHIENAMIKKMKFNKKRPYKHGKIC